MRPAAAAAGVEHPADIPTLRARQLWQNVTTAWGLQAPTGYGEEGAKQLFRNMIAPARYDLG